MAEYWDLYDENGNTTGYTHLRGEAVPKGLFHIVVEVAVIGRDGRLLLTRRFPDKPWGNLLEITGGSAVLGEDSAAAAIRELKEETGISVLPDKLYFVRRIKGNSAFHDLYYTVNDTTAEEVVLQEGETTEAMRVSRTEFIQLCEAGEFCEPLRERFYDDIIRIFELGKGI